LIEKCIDFSIESWRFSALYKKRVMKLHFC